MAAVDQLQKLTDLSSSSKIVLDGCSTTCTYFLELK